MSKLLKIVAAVLIALSVGAPSAFAKSDHAKESLTALGDSIPFGYNLGQNNKTPAKTAFPYLITEEADLRVRNLGVPGWQTEDLLSALETDQKFRQAVKQADYVTVNIGSNDLLEIIRAANAESGGNPQLFQQLLAQKLAASGIFANLSEINQEIRSLTDAPIILYNIYNPFQLNDPLHQIADLFLPQINAGYANLTHTYSNAFIADAYTAFGDNQAAYVLPRDIHPTAAGQKVLAEIGLQALLLNQVRN